MLFGGWEDRALQECNPSAQFVRGLRMHPPPGPLRRAGRSPSATMAKAIKLLPSYRVILRGRGRRIEQAWRRFYLLLPFVQKTQLQALEAKRPKPVAHRLQTDLLPA